MPNYLIWISLYPCEHKVLFLMFYYNLLYTYEFNYLYGTHHSNTLMLLMHSFQNVYILLEKANESIQYQLIRKGIGRATVLWKERNKENVRCILCSCLIWIDELKRLHHNIHEICTNIYIYIYITIEK